MFIVLLLSRIVSVHMPLVIVFCCSSRANVTRLQIRNGDSGRTVGSHGDHYDPYILSFVMFIKQAELTGKAPNY